MNNGANPTSIIYDKLGRKKSMNDPDKGRWSYRYNAFGELVEQTDAKLQKSRMHYDTLGRMIERVDRLRDGAIEQSSEWVYDRAVNGIGQLASVRMVDGTDNEKTFDSYRYDTLGRLVSSTRTLEGSYSYTSTQTYNSIGQLYQQFDGSNNQRDNGYRGVQYGYDAGVQVVVEDVRRTDSGQPFRVYDQILDVDARGNVVSSQHGMVFTTRIYDPATGRLTKVKSNKGSTFGSELQNLSYDWDTLGNLSSRHDQSGTKNLYERYDYDALNRLKVSNSNVNGQHYQQSVSYNAQGNIISKSDVESGASYQYGGQKTGCARTAGPHAVTQIGDTVYCYDENGNNISGDGRTLSYSSFDKVTSIITDDASIRFTYDHNRSRYRRDDTIKGKQSTTWYLGNVEVIESVTDANETKLEYRRSVGSAVESTIYINGEYQQERTSYLLSDHLGSIDLITDVNGSIIEHQSFIRDSCRSPVGLTPHAVLFKNCILHFCDAWGMRRNALDAAMLVAQNQGNFDFATDFSSAITKRGFTGHEMLDAVGIIHMNGRIYDPKLARFLQADPHIQAPYNTQSLNRYSYVLNNPLNATDPSGYFFVALITAIVSAISAISVTTFVITAVATYLVSGIAQYLGIGWLATIAQIVGCAYGVCAGAAFGSTLGSGGSFGDALKAAVMSVVQQQVFTQIGGNFDKAKGFFKKGGVGHIGSHAVAGGVFAELQGGKFGHGFVSAGVTKALTPYISKVDSGIDIEGKDIGQAAIAATVGGTVSELTGGKFANGAITAAYGNLFNEQRDPPKQRPSYEDVNANYPKNAEGGDMAGADVYESVGGKVYEMHKATGNSNACAVRVSHALNMSGVDIPKIEGKTYEGANGKNYFLAASDLESWLVENWGDPDVRVYDNFDTKLQGNKGIYIMRPRRPVDFNASGHATLYNGSDCIGGNCYFNASGGYISYKYLESKMKRYLFICFLLVIAQANSNFEDITNSLIFEEKRKIFEAEEQKLSNRSIDEKKITFKKYFLVMCIKRAFGDNHIFSVALRDYDSSFGYTIELFIQDIGNLSKVKEISNYSSTYISKLKVNTVGERHDDSHSENVDRFPILEKCLSHYESIELDKYAENMLD